MRTLKLRTALLAALLGGVLPGAVAARAPGHWPCWRGVDRTNVSPEKGLLQKWPEAGPPLAWKASGLGEGVASVAVAGGRVYTLGQRGDDEKVTALDEVTGKPVWSVRIGAAVRENPVMRWLSQRTPTVDDERLYAFTARGELVCLQTADGKELWRKSYPDDFDGKTGVWGWCDRPLVDGDRLVCVPGGATATVVALDKKTGEVLWKCAGDGEDRASYAATVVATPGRVRQYVAYLSGGLVGVAAADGKLLWRYKHAGNRSANNYTPIVWGANLFYASGYNTGLGLLKLGDDKAEEVWFRKQSLPPWHDGAVLVGEHVYLGIGKDLACLEVATGKVLWQDPGAVGGSVSTTCADGHLYLRSRQRKVALVEATPKGHVLKGTFQVPDAAEKAGSTAPVVAGGRLYLRDDDALFCYDVLDGTPKPAPAPPPAPPKDRPETPGAPEPRGRREPDAVFVPTPQDVVEKMLELAKVKRADLVYDLGCGDGRIVVTAARKYGCKAAGYDVDPECVRMSLDNVRKHDVGGLVTIEKKDIFTLDLSKADVIALYLLPKMNERLVPQFGKLRPGARIVSHAFEIPGVKPDQVATCRSAEDDVEHKIYLYTTPLKRSKPGE
jgi:outer membrane protein assembly factor BamB